MSLESTGIPQKYIDRLRATVVNDTVMHAYIFESDSTVDKVLLAREFAKAILCEEHTGSGCDKCLTCQRIDRENHEDIIYAEANENGNVVDKEMERIQGRLKLKPLVGSRTIVIIPNADTLTVRAQNRLLKTLEEPTPGTVIMLLSENIENLIQTIRSRCVIYRISNYNSVPDSEYMDMAQEIVSMLSSRAPFYKLVKIIEPLGSKRQEVICLLEAMEYVYRDILIGKSDKKRLYKRQYIYDAVSVLESAKRDITTITGIKADYMLKDVLLKIGGK
ncbi:MAG: hypothetical protein J5622_04940 [Firmicutes bacterium]|nr:hypothetical protein [Bacillota bacterium]